MSSPSQSEIADIIKEQGYNSAIVSSLEAYLHLQADAKNPAPYFFDANRVLIKHYTFNPQLFNVENLILAQLLAVVYGSCDGRVDFGSLNCLVSDRCKQGETFVILSRCADLFSACQFSEFWKVYKTLCSKDTFSSVQVLADSPITYLQLRKSILSILSLTFKSMTIDETLLAFLNFSNEDELIEMLDVGDLKKIVDGIIDGKVIFHARPENTKRAKVFQESVDFGVIKGLLNSGQ